MLHITVTPNPKFTRPYRNLSQIWWASCWELPVNISKTAVFHIGKASNLVYKIEGVDLKNLREVRDLGVDLNNDLNFESHVNTTVRKAFAALFVICRLLINCHFGCVWYSSI